MLQQLGHCAVRKAFKVTEDNCIGFREEENVCEEAKEGHKPQEDSQI